MPNLLTHLLLALRNRANIALLTLTALMAILAPEPASAQTTPTFGTATGPDTTYTVNVAVSDTLPAAGTGALTYTLTPALPAGLTYKAATSGNGGIIAGVPTTVASATTYTLTATDASNATATLTFTISVALSSDATLSRLTFYSVEQAASGTGGVGGQAGSSDATLREIEIGDYTHTLTDTFRFTVKAKVTLLTVKPTTSDSAATYTITPADARSRPAGHQVNLVSGPNTITIEVTAENRSTTKTYIIIVTRRTPIDYDDDGDGLIDVTTLAQLNAIRYDLDGDGRVDNPDYENAYAEAFPDIGPIPREYSMGCDRPCTGYELLENLDFDKNGDGSITATDSTAFFAIGATDSSGFVPIGLGTNREFDAIFQGNGKTISNLVINSTKDYVGLFYSVGGDHATGRIEGVGLIDAKVTGKNNVGALVGTNHGTVANCFVTGAVSGNSAVGGLVGHNYERRPVIASYSTASVTGASVVGALVGSNSGAIQASYAIGKVRVSGLTQGLVGSHRSRTGSITHSYYDSVTTEVSGPYAGAKTTAQLQAPTSYFSTLGNGADTIYAAWNVNVDSTFTNPPNNTPDDPWNFGESNQYPVLKLYNYDTAAQFAAQPDKAPTFGTATIRDTTYLVARAVSDTLPAATATSGNGKLTYALTPNLPAGLTFDNMTRVIAGTPTAAASASTYTLTVRDADSNTATRDTDSLTFTIAATVVVSIPDANLRAVITDSLSKARNASINNAEMLHLTRLDAPNKGIRNLTGLEFATNLDTLELSHNNITAIDSLSGLDSLKTLWLRNNLISDLEPLALNTGLGSGDYVDVRGNPLSAASRTTHIDTLTIRGVTVRYDTLSVAELVPVWGDGQIGMAGAALMDSFVVRVQRKNPASYPYRNLPVTFSVAADGGRLSATSDTTDSDGLAHTRLTLGADVGTDTVTVKAFVEGALDTLFFIAMPIRSVTIADANLRAVIERSLEKEAGDTITNADMSRLTGLYATERGITDLTGLESATNLSTLVLDSTKIADISPLSGLTNLLGLWLSDTKIADISPLSGLTNLSELWLRNNTNITDISPLSGLTNLSTLDLRNTNITAIDSLSGLTNLSRLYLGGTDITDISPLSGLTNLSNLELNSTNITAIDSLSGLTNLLSLWLDNTNITDISPLSGLTSLLYLELDDTNITAIDSLSGLTALSSLSLDNNRISDLSPLVLNSRLSTVNVRGNPLSAASRTSYIPTLTGRGVTVRYDTLSVAQLVNVSGDGQTGTASTPLANPFVVKVRSANDTTYAYRNLPVTFSVAAGGGTLSATSDTTDSDGLARTLLTLGTTVGTDTVKAVVEGASGTSFFIFTTLSPISVTIPDDSLRAVIKRSLGKTNPADTIRSSDMSRLTRLDAPNKGISDLTGLEFATQLDTLDLRANTISDLSPLSGLTNLKMLHLRSDGNSISDISYLSGLTELTVLNLAGKGNRISDLSPLSRLTNLKRLHVGSGAGDGLSDLSPLSRLINLELLILSGEDNRLSDISHLSGLTKLTYLNLRGTGNRLSDLSHLSGLTDLETLILSGGGNRLSDLSHLSGLTKLTYLNLSGEGNSISDISHLSGLTNLTYLNLGGGGNSISDISHLSGLTNLSRLYLGGNNITAIDSLSGLTALSSLSLDNNRISDLSPLVPNSGLGSGDRVGVRGNPLSALSRGTHIPALTRKGVTVDFDPLSAARLVKDSGDGQTGTAGMALANPFVVQVRSANDTTYAYRHLPVTFSVAAGGGTLSATSDTTDSDGLARTRLTLGATVGMDTVKAFVEGASDTLIFTTMPIMSVTIPDDSLRAMIELYLGKSAGDTITNVDMLRLTRLRARNKGITDLTGLKFATNLSYLDLRFNNITDISHLAGLDSLSWIDLRVNNITDISHLSGVDSLSNLDLRFNNITDISPLAGLTNLSWRLLLGNNNITDISHLAGLTNLSNLGLNNNNITDISPLAGLDSLSLLSLDNNRISDLSPLTSNTGLGSGDIVNVRGNPLSAASRTSHIPTLTSSSRGVTVRYDSLSAAQLVKASGDGQTGTARMPLANPFVVKVQSKHNATHPYRHLPVTFSVAAGGGRLSATSDTTDSNGLARTLLTSGTTVGMDTVKAFVEGVSDTLIFTTVSPRPVTIPDDSLRAVIESSLGKSAGDTIWSSDMLRLTWLYAANTGIADLTGLEFATRLDTLNLGHGTGDSRHRNSNNITDIRSLSGLTRLKFLSLERNAISDISPLRNLTRLKVLDLRVNKISDISVLQHLTNLTRLLLAHNPIKKVNGVTDISSLSRLTNLTHLYFRGASITDLSPLRGLTNLTSLELGGKNSITDLSPLRGLTNLTILSIGNKSRKNRVTDLSPLSGLTNLSGLGLGGFTITDISPLSGLTNLSNLSLPNNRISDLSPLVPNSGLGSGDRVGVRGNPLSALSRGTHIPALTRKGVTVDFDPLSAARLVKVSGDGQTGTARMPLANPFVVKVQSKHNATHPYRNLPVTFLVAAGGGTLSAIPDTTDYDGFARTRLTLGATVGMDTVKAFVEGASDTLIFSTVPIMSVTISDDSLRAVVLDSLNKSAGDTITNVDMLRLTQLVAPNKDIRDLTGLEFATQLNTLDLGKNTISDLSSLAGLTELTVLILRGNRVSDLSPLSGLTKLTYLNLRGNDNRVSDLSPLSGLTKLTDLRLRGHGNSISDLSHLSRLTELTRLNLGGHSNRISDLRPLSGLTELTYLNLGGHSNRISDLRPLSGLTNLIDLYLHGTSNRFSDLSPLSGLTNLIRLELRDNRISDISPLTLNTGLGSGDYVDVRGNPLSALSRGTHIPTLTGNSVTVWFDTLSVARLVKVSGDGQTGTAGAALADSLVVKVQSKNDATYLYSLCHWAGVCTESAENDATHPYRNLPVTFLAAAGGGRLSATSDTTDYDGFARTRLTLGTTVGMDTVKAFVEGASDTLIFTTVSPRSVTIADANLRAVIGDSLSISPDSTITNADMLGLTRLDAPNKGISNLTGLEFATQLDTLDLSNNRISNIDSLAGLTRLKKLSLGGNRIADIDSLARLTDLTWLWLSYNAIVDIDSLANLTDLTWLGLGGNRISNIASLAGLTHLTRLGLSNNAIADIDSLAGLTRLKKLSLDGNRIAAIDSLARLTDLTWLGLSNNRISNLSPLTSNAGLGSGDHVDVRGNPLSTASRTTHIPTLQRKSVTVTFDNLTGLSLVKVSGDGQIGTVGTALANPFVVKVEDQNRRGYAGLPVTFSVTAGGGSLSALTDTTDATGQAETILTLGPTASTHTCSVSVAGLSQTLTFTATLPTPDFDGNGRVNFADFMALASKMGAVQGRGSYEVKYDLDGDGVIGMGDFRILTSRFGDGKFDDAK